MFFKYYKRGCLCIKELHSLTAECDFEHPDESSAILGVDALGQSDLVADYTSWETAEMVLNCVYLAIEEGRRIFDFTDPKFDHIRYTEVRPGEDVFDGFYDYDNRKKSKIQDLRIPDIKNDEQYEIFDEE